MAKTNELNCFEKVASLYCDLDNFHISLIEFNHKVKLISEESGISIRLLKEKGYELSF